MSSWWYQAAVGGGIRIVESIFAAGPTLLVGLLIAAVLRFYLGPDGTKRLFGGDSLRALPQSWAVGMLMPVCSIGVLPVLFEMRRCRIKPGAMFAFALSAPLFNPLSLLYGLTLSRPYVIIMFAIGSLAVVTIVGLAWDWFARKDDLDHDSERAEKSPIIGVERLLATMVYVCRQLAGPAGGWMLVGTLGMLLLATFLPWGSLQTGLNRDDWWAPARMASVAVPAYATPMMTMSQIGTMFQHANSPGAAFILLVVGAGVNLATIIWLARQFGFRRTALWFGCLMVVVVGIAYAINRPLVPPGVDPVEHSHAFDIYTNPLHHLDTASGRFALKKLEERFGLIEQITLTILGFITCLGLIFRAIGWEGELGRSARDSQAPETPKAPEANNEPELANWDRIVGPQAVGATMLIGMVAMSVVMCFAYYPSTQECLEEIHIIRGNLVSGARSGDADFASFWIPRFDDWTRRLEVGTFLRRGEVTPYQRMQGYLIRKKLETLEHELAHDHDTPQSLWGAVDDLESTYTRWSCAFRNQPIPNVVISGDETDQDIDSSHDHGHVHSNGHSHDHAGAQHERHHAHSRGHDNLPHGGQVVDLGSDASTLRGQSLYLEALPIRDARIVIYPLKKQLGVWRSVTQPNATLNLRIQPVNIGSEESPEVPTEMVWDSELAAFEAPLPTECQTAARLSIDAQYRLDDDRVLEATFELMVDE